MRARKRPQKPTSRQSLMNRTARAQAGNKALAEAIKAMRIAYGLRQQDVAEALGAPQPWITRIERGEREIGVFVFLEIAEAIGFNPVEVVRKIKRKLKYPTHD